ncbi:MAG: preprotein translocase subunit SecE [Candidatus Portnoybacteria bacterium]|nr:preprotein translocase subunit SecE [Candidatus Portnoybacteria bacterium]MDD4982911.1 preprotein translocase subunit SecE [Candidatus Portnoybacteria bacterium]
MFNRIITFFSEVKAELKKVTWPTRQETYNYTLTVVGISLGAALFLGLADFVFQLLMNKFII